VEPLSIITGQFLMHNNSRFHSHSWIILPTICLFFLPSPTPPPPLSIVIYFQGRKPHIKTPDRAAHGYCSPGKGEGGRGVNTGIRVGAIIQS